MFQFRNIETNYVYTLNEIDEIAAKFWGVEVDKREYASPIINGKYGINWFDVLGHAIEDLQYYNTKNLDGSLCYHKAFTKDEMLNPLFKFDDIVPQIVVRCVCADTMDSLEYGFNLYKPYFELCYHLKDLGIVGVGMGW